MNEKSIKIGFLTVSDRASRGEYEDLGGPAMQAWVKQAMDSPWHAEAMLVADDQAQIEQALIKLSDTLGCQVILTTGGTGPAARDVTPEATENVCHRLLDGFGEQMRAVSLQTVPTAILSRQIAGTRGVSLIINLPGKPDSIAVCLSAVFLAVPKCLELLDGTHIRINREFIIANLQT